MGVSLLNVSGTSQLYHKPKTKCDFCAQYQVSHITPLVVVVAQTVERWRDVLSDRSLHDWENGEGTVATPRLNCPPAPTQLSSAGGALPYL